MTDSIINRRRFCEFLGGVGATLPLVPELLAKPRKIGLPAGNHDGKLQLAAGFAYYLIATSNDPINPAGELFGVSTDFNGIIPHPRSGEGFLLVNHESPDAALTSGGRKADDKTKVDIDQERLSVGCSILKLGFEKKSRRWAFSQNAENWRIHGATTIPFSGGTEIEGKKSAVGTFANCSGGVTPWGTFLTCEENYADYYGDRVPQVAKPVYGWERFYQEPPEHFGWVVEIDPKSRQAQKLVGLGRFAHEGALVVPLADERAVVYMADDAAGECVYKFVATKPKSLEDGTLFVANLDAGIWVPLNLDHKLLRGQYKSHADLMIHARAAAKLVGGTPLDRPEGIARHPLTGEIFISLTNNTKKSNLYGSLLCLSEKNGDHAGTNLSHRTFLAGGDDSGFSCPDNICFDAKGGLWMTTDVSGSAMQEKDYLRFGNNGLYYIPTVGADAGKVLRIATAPAGAEFTGPCLLPDGKTLLVSVQHPGDGIKDPKNSAHHWPEGGKKIAKSAVIAIQLGGHVT